MYIHEEDKFIGATHVHTSSEYVHWRHPCIKIKRIRLLEPIMYIHQENAFIGATHV